jgi:two-component system chemotaxis response regulator CheB
MSLKVLVVDDTIMYRKIIADILAAMPEVEVVGTAGNGRVALSRMRLLKPDLVTLDVEMPLMNGLEVLQAMRQEHLDIACLMLSSLTERGSAVTMEALELGAFDFILKPDGATMEENNARLRRALTDLIRVFVQQRRLRRCLHELPTPGRTEKCSSLPFRSAAGETVGAPPLPSAPLRAAAVRGMRKSAVIAIGISTGGPNALAAMLPQLPADLGVPVLVVQHMPPLFTRSLAESLGRKCRLAVKEAADGDVVQANVVYIAPGGRQMKVVAGADGGKLLRITDDPPENNCKPAVDYLFRSVAREYGPRATGVIMTGMGSDGRLGLRVMKSTGAVAIAQDADTCVVYGMPKAVIDAGLADVIAPLDGIAAEIVKTVR